MGGETACGLGGLGTLLVAWPGLAQLLHDPRAEGGVLLAPHVLHPAVGRRTGRGVERNPGCARVGHASIVLRDRGVTPDGHAAFTTSVG